VTARSLPGLDVCPANISPIPKFFDSTIHNRIIRKFDCGYSEALFHRFLAQVGTLQKGLFAKTLIWTATTGDLAAYACLYNASIPIKESPIVESLPAWTRKDQLEIPCVKLWMVARSVKYAKQNLGASVIQYLTMLFASDSNRTGCRFLILDSLESRVTFYESLGFKRLKATKTSGLVSMYFDLLPIHKQIIAAKKVKS
jgi:hypothetical protein